MQTQNPRRFISRLAPVCLAGSLAFGGAALAATVDGTVGPTSSGTLDVTMNVPALALIENLDPIVLNWSSTDVTGQDTFCIWSTTGGYNITVDSQNGAGGGFVAADGAANLTYSVIFNDDTDPTTGTAVTDGVNLSTTPSLATADSSFPPGCAADNAVLQVTFPYSGNLDSAAQGTYTDTMTLTVSPE
jgi:hypothetical protein